MGLAQDWFSEETFWNLPLKLLSTLFGMIVKKQAAGLLFTTQWPAKYCYTRPISFAEPHVFCSEILSTENLGTLISLRKVITAGMARDPADIWINTQNATRLWKSTLNPSDFLCRAIKFRLLEKTARTFPSETKFSFPRITFNPEHADWLREELTDSLHRRIYEEVPKYEELSLHNVDVTID